MKDENEKIELTEDYVGKVKIKDKAVLSEAHAEIKRLYGKKENQKSLGKRFNLKLLGAIIPVMVVIIFSAIFFPLYFKPEEEFRYKNIGETISDSYSSIAEYNAENGTSFLYFDDSTANDTKIAVSKETGDFAFLKQTLIYSYDGSIDSIIFYASPNSVICEEFKEFNKIEEKTVYEGITIYNKEEVKGGTYKVYARFTYGNANYFLSIDSGESGVLTKYIDLLFTSKAN